jgi:hypothetical protein
MRIKVTGSALLLGVASITLNAQSPQMFALEDHTAILEIREATLSAIAQIKPLEEQSKEPCVQAHMRTLTKLSEHLKDLASGIETKIKSKADKKDTDAAANVDFLKSVWRRLIALGNEAEDIDPCEPVDENLGPDEYFWLQWRAERVLSDIIVRMGSK